MKPERLLDWIALNLLPGLGPVSLGQALELWKDPGRIAHAVPCDALRSLRGFRARDTEPLRQARQGLRRRAEREWRRCEKLGLRLLVRGDPDYPAALETLPDPPIILYIRGELPPGRTRVAVVGARRATAYGQRIAVGLGAGLAARGIEVVSGGARGIDTSAHLGALEERGRTIAVLGSGFARPYPTENAPLFERIAQSGAVMTEFALDQAPHAGCFPRRNRLVSGLSAAVVVVEADLRSGSLITARHAAEQGRDVLAVPGLVSSERSQGCHRLIQDGAKLVQNVDDVVAELGPMYQGPVETLPDPRAAAPGGRPVEATPDETAVFDLLDEVDPVHLDLLADRAPFGIARLQAALFGLEVRGAAESLTGGYYRRR